MDKIAIWIGVAGVIIGYVVFFIETRRAQEYAKEAAHREEIYRIRMDCISVAIAELGELGDPPEGLAEAQAWIGVLQNLLKTIKGAADGR